MRAGLRRIEQRLSIACGISLALSSVLSIFVEYRRTGFPFRAIMLSPLPIFVVLSLLLLVLFNAGSRRRKLPPGCKPIPGPPGLPLIGNLHQIPTDYPWRQFKEWSDKYGPIMEVKLGTESLIVLSDDNTARELLERRGQMYV